MPESSPASQSHVDTLKISRANGGFYDGFNKTVAIVPKLLISALIIWTTSDPKRAGDILLSLQTWTTDTFGGWYIYLSAFIMTLVIVLALLPKSGKRLLGAPGDTPAFSRFSWFSMMFGAGIGIGMLTYSTAEPIFHFAANPETIMGLAEGQTAENVRNAYKWAFLHYALTPWGFYALVGIALAYFSYNRGLPLTIRAPLQPLFGNALSGPVGHAIDIAAILATIIGVGVTIGYGVSQFASGIYNISPMSWLMNAEGTPSLAAQISALTIILAASTVSAMSGVNKGIKWLSNINMSLSFFLLLFFVFFGALGFAIQSFGYAIWDYIVSLPSMSLTVWHNTGTETSKALAEWQRDWTIFYWAWWIAFAPFVGLFLARVSRGRSIREYVLGAVIVPALTCLTWFTLVGGTAIDLELTGVANGSIVSADISAQLFQTINLILPPNLAIAMSVLIVILLLTYLVTSVDSAILIITTLASAGDQRRKNGKHIIIWGLIFVAAISSLLAAGGMDALRSAMIIGALPFSLVMALMSIALIKALLFTKR